MPAKGDNITSDTLPDVQHNFLSMKKSIISSLLCSAVLCAGAQEKKVFNDTTFLQPIEVNSIRAGEKAPFAKTTLSKKVIDKSNIGQDLPFILNQTPSVVVNSDAGNGVGYTGIRIRGTDGTRVNVTLNGIPFNDGESQISYFVDIPDIASSANSIQIQRGVGTSSNGAGAFGGTINLSTNELNEKFYADFNSSAGSYNTWKNTFRFGSGILGKHVTFDARVSKISSDGYVDRASSDLKSAYLSTAYIDSKNSLRFNFITGKEKTYQAWNGISKSYLDSNRTYNSSGQEQPGKPYDNETDNFTQTHYQLFYNHKISANWKYNVAAFLTHGIGYYEGYKANEALSTYHLYDYNSGGNIITNTDMVRQLWVDNNFYGSIFSVQYQKKNTQLAIGGGWNRTDGRHYGKIIWAKEQLAVPFNYKWYNLTANKKDFSVYAKLTQQIKKHWQAYADIQYRNVQYNIYGFRNNPTLQINNQYHFVNPKLGLTYSNKNWMAFVSYALGSKEPNRDDFEAGRTLQPKYETLHDVELGVERKNEHYAFGATVYYMRYRNQLVLVGNINDVGAYTRTNIPTSYRLGLELQGKFMVKKWLNVSANIAFSENKVKNFTEQIDDFDNGGTQLLFYKKADLSFSPAIVGGGTINLIPVKHGEISFISKYVGKQFLDNTAQNARSLDAYFVQDIKLSYSLDKKVFKATTVFVQLNNVFDKKYVSNGYTFSYIYGGLQTENYYFPMAPFNFMAGINISL